MQVSPSQKESSAHTSLSTQARTNLMNKKSLVNETSLQESQGLGPVLKNSNFLLLWVGQIFSQLADKVYLVLMIALIAAFFQGEEQPISVWVSAIMIAFTIPAVLFGSLAGVFVDRWSKKGVLVISNLLRGLFVIIIPPILWLSQGKNLSLPVSWLPISWRQWHGETQETFYLPLGFLILLLLTFICSTLTQFFAPAEQATIPLIVKNRNLLPANSLFTTTIMGTLIIGFAIGSPLLEWAANLVRYLGLSWDWGKSLVVGGSYSLAGLILIFLKTPEKPEHLAPETPHIFTDIQDGIRYLQENNRVRNALVQLIILFSIFAALSVLAVRLAETIPGMRAEQFGILLASGGVGLAIGAGILGNWGQQFANSRLSLWGSIGMGVALLALSFSTHSLWLALVSTTILGFFASLVGVPMQTTIQAETPPEMRGKVFGLQNNAVNIALSLPLALAGIAETIFGLQSVFISLAVLSLLGGVLTWYMRQKSLKVN